MSYSKALAWGLSFTCDSAPRRSVAAARARDGGCSARMLMVAPWEEHRRLLLQRALGTRRKALATASRPSRKSRPFVFVAAGGRMVGCSDGHVVLVKRGVGYQVGRTPVVVGNGRASRSIPVALFRFPSSIDVCDSIGRLGQPVTPIMHQIGTPGGVRCLRRCAGRGVVALVALEHAHTRTHAR